MRITMRLFKKAESGIWYVEMDSGRRKSLRTRDKAVATRLFNRIKREYLESKVSQITGRCAKTLGEYASEYLAWAEQVQPRSTFRANRLALDKILYHAGPGLSLDRLGPRALDEMVAASKAAGLSDASINNYIRHSRAALNKAVEWGYLRSNPLASVKELPSRRRQPAFLRREDVARFLDSIADNDVRLMVVAYLATGRRRGELIRLRWEQVDLEAGRYLVEAGKNHLSTWYPINSMFRAVLEMIGPGKGLVFPRWRHMDTISKVVKRALIAAGFGNLRLHDLRHTFASLQVMQGRTLKEVQGLLGHTESRTTEIYAHLADDHLAEAAEIYLGPVDLGKRSKPK